MAEFKLTKYDIAKKIGFVKTFLAEYALDPTSTVWTPLGDVLRDLQLRLDINYYSSYMLLWIREICVAANLRREDRPLGPGHVDLEEGYYGILRK